MEDNKEILKELRDIKKLLMCFLIRAGASSDIVGRALGVDGSTVRRMIPVSKINKPPSQNN